MKNEEGPITTAESEIFIACSSDAHDRLGRGFRKQISSGHEIPRVVASRE